MFVFLYTGGYLVTSTENLCIGGELLRGLLSYYNENVSTAWAYEHMTDKFNRSYTVVYLLHDTKWLQLTKLSAIKIPFWEWIKNKKI